MLLTSVYILSTLAASGPTTTGVELKLLTTGATKKSGGYRPIRADLGAEPTLKAKPAGLTAPQFGSIKVGEKSYAFILDEPEGKPAKLYVDSNGDGDLTNDPATTWEPQTRGKSTMYFGSAKVDIGQGGLAAINLYRFDPKDPQRAALKNTVMYYYDFGYEVKLNLDRKTFETFVAGFPSSESSLAVDRNGDGQISYKREMIQVGKPFNFTGTTYQLEVKDGGLILEKAKVRLPKAPLPPDVAVGKKALKFDAVAMDGSKVSFPRDYKGKLVMLDFWATWCGPCIAELPNVKAAYAKWHDAGYEILGISFDQKDQADKVKDFTGKNGMTWKHVYEGKFWDTTLGDLYDVGGIPFVLLVDGDTGEILGNEVNLRGPGITDFIGKALEKKNAKK